MHVHYSEEGYDDSECDVQYSHSYKLKGMSYNAGVHAACISVGTGVYKHTIFGQKQRSKERALNLTLYNLIMNALVIDLSRCITFTEIIQGLSNLKL